jgi:hypothetical protein
MRGDRCKKRKERQHRNAEGDGPDQGLARWACQSERPDSLRPASTPEDHLDQHRSRDDDKANQQAPFATCAAQSRSDPVEQHKQCEKREDDTGGQTRPEFNGAIVVVRTRYHALP